jgi:hypothetical protein
MAKCPHFDFRADIHRCMTASWPVFVGGAALVFVAFNAFFAFFYRLADQPIANVPGGQSVDYLYFSIEKLSTAGYGDMYPQTHYGHFFATIEPFTGIFSMSLTTGHRPELSAWRPRCGRPRSHWRLIVVVSGCDVVAAQTVHARKSCDGPDIRFGHRYAEILGTADDGRLRIDDSRFHETLKG